MSQKTNLDTLKTEIRSLIISNPFGLTLNDFMKDYCKFIGKPFPYNEYGYETPLLFLQSLTDVVKIQKTKYGPLLVAVLNPQVVHINNLVTNQRKPKSLLPPIRKSKMVLTSGSHILNSSLKIQNTLEMNNVVVNDTPVIDYRKLDEIHFDLDSINIDNDLFQIDKQMRSDEKLPSTSESFVSLPTESICNDNVSDQMKKNFKLILQEHETGVSINKFTSLYKEKFNYPLNIQDLGYSSMRELIISLPDIFSFEKNKFTNDWILYDARMYLINHKIDTKFRGQSKWIPQCVQVNLAKLVEKFPLGLNRDSVLLEYEKEYKTKINIEKLGCDSISTFLTNCKGIVLKIVGNDCLIFTKNSNEQIENDTASDCALALPSNEQLKHLWKTYFPEDVCDISYSYKKCELPANVKELKVTVSDVHSPDGVWLQPIETAARLNKLMLDLNTFYENADEHYEMKENVIKPGQVCCARFNIDEKWYRSLILQVVNKNKIKVCYVDYGTISYGDLSDFRFLHKKFIEDPIFVFKSKLYNLVPNISDIDEQGAAVDEWPKNVNYYLFDLLYLKPFFASIVEIIDDSPFASIILTDASRKPDITIQDLLIQEGFAKSAALTEVSEDNKNNQQEELTINEFDTSLGEVSSLIIKNLLPACFFGTNVNSSEEFYNFLDQIADSLDGTTELTELQRCCQSHFIKSMFLTDPQLISSIWRDVISRNIVYLYQEFFKQVSKIVPVPHSCFDMHPFCDEFPPDIINNNVLKTPKRESRQKVLSSRHVSRISLECEREMVENVTRNFLKSINDDGKNESLKTHNDDHPVIDQHFGDSDEELMHLFTMCYGGAKTTLLKPQSSGGGNNTGTTPLNTLSTQIKFSVFIADLEHDKNLMIIKCLNEFYVIYDQILKEFTADISSLLLQHRINKLINQHENITVTAADQPKLFTCLQKHLVEMRGHDEVVLMPLSNVSTFLRTVSPEKRSAASQFDVLASHHLLKKEMGDDQVNS